MSVARESRVWALSLRVEWFRVLVTEKGTTLEGVGLEL